MAFTGWRVISTTQFDDQCWQGCLMWATLAVEEPDSAHGSDMRTAYSSGNQFTVQSA